VLTAAAVNASGICTPLKIISSESDIATDEAPGALPASCPAWRLYAPAQRWGFLAILFLVTTANYFDYFVIAVLLEPVKSEFRVSDTMLGLLSGFCFALVYALAALPIARWADRGNRRTVITLALAGWSAMTVVCGFAQSFWQLALARFGVGVFEPGAMPPAQSLVADYFPPDRRATAITILVGGASAVGWLVGIGLGGYIAATYGWRAAFWMAGAPGFALAVIVRLTLAEPRCQLGFPRAEMHAESFGQSIGRLARKQSFLYSLVGISVYTIFAYGITVFVPSFMIRSLHTTLENVSMLWGCAISASNIIGALIGGRIADGLHSRDIRWYAWLPAIACVLGLPLYWLALSARHVWVFISVEFLAELILSVGIPVTFAAVLIVCGSRRRSIATATLYCSTVLIGGTLGPLLSGAMSDAFSPAYGPESLRYSLTVMCVFLIPAAAAYCKAAHAMPQDLDE
jgi:predicted MFS family arabinose efflux permease